MATYSQKQGDTSAIIYTRPGVLADGDPIDGNWSCKTKVVTYNGTVLVNTRDVTDIVTVDKADSDLHGQEAFMVYLTPAETELLNVTGVNQEHLWAYETVNNTTSPIFKKETHNKIQVSEQIITA